MLSGPTAYRRVIQSITTQSNGLSTKAHLTSRKYSVIASVNSVSSFQRQKYSDTLRYSQSQTTSSTSSHFFFFQQSRTFSRSSESEPLNPELKAKQFVIRVGYDAKVAQGVVDALKESGLSGTALLTTVNRMAGRWEVGEDAGLEALAEAVKLNLARKEGRKAITIYCIPGHAWKSSEEDQPDFSPVNETPEEKEAMMARAFKVEAMTGLTLTDVAKFGDGEGASVLGDSLECACAGIMACSTCHVVIDQEWYDKVGEPCDDELDMLELAYAPRKTSRLGCQVLLEENMDGMLIRLPRGANNLMDHVPFE